MGTSRLRGVRPGRVGVFAGSLETRPVEMQRTVAREIERLGFGSLWYGEWFVRETFAQAAILLAATDRLVVGSGIAIIWVRDPMAMANGGRALAEAWPNRFILGLGVSHARTVEARGHHYERPYSKMADYLQALEAARWVGPKVDLPPIVLAALGPRMVDLAASRTAGVYPYFTTDDQVRAMRQAIGEEPFLVSDLPVVLADDRRAAREIGDPYIHYYLIEDNYRNNLLRLGFDASDVEPPGSDRLFDAVVAWGDPAAIQAAIVRRLEAGADHVVLNIVTEDEARSYVPELERLAPVVRAIEQRPWPTGSA